MADIEVVIKIDEDIYNRFTHNEVRPRFEITEEERFQMDADVVRLTRAFCNGIPLPEGHGRLIDADALLAEIECLKRSPWYESDIMGSYVVRKEAVGMIEDLCIKNAPTVIEANKDAISRQAVIDVIERWLECSGYNEAERHIMKAVQSVLYESPSVNPQPICEEREKGECPWYAG